MGRNASYGRFFLTTGAPDDGAGLEGVGTALAGGEGVRLTRRESVALVGVPVGLADGGETDFRGPVKVLLTSWGGLARKGAEADGAVLV